MKILIFGMGFIGRPLAEKCYESGYEVRAVKQHLTSDDINLPIDLDTISLDVGVFNPEWANYPIWVILLPPSRLNYLNNQNNYLETISYLINQAEKYQIQQIIYSSSTSVFGNSVGRFDEFSPIDLANIETENAKNIYLIEQKLLESKINQVNIVRLGGLYGTTRHPLNTLINKNKPLENPNHWVNMIHQDRVVLGLLKIIQNNQDIDFKNRKIIHFVETPHLTKFEFYQQEAKILGIPESDLELLFKFNDLNENNNNQGKQIVSIYCDLLC